MAESSRPPGRSRTSDGSRASQSASTSCGTGGWAAPSARTATSATADHAPASISSRIAAGRRSRPTNTSAARRRASAISSGRASSARNDCHSACNVRSPLGTSVTSGRSAVRARTSVVAAERRLGQLVVERSEVGEQGQVPPLRRVEAGEHLLADVVRRGIGTGAGGQLGKGRPPVARRDLAARHAAQVSEPVELLGREREQVLAHAAHPARHLDPGQRDRRLTSAGEHEVCVRRERGDDRRQQVARPTTPEARAARRR